MDLVFRKLETRSPLNDAEKSALSRTFVLVRTFEPGVDVLSQGQSSFFVGALLSGQLCRQKSLQKGLRQILALPVAGDIFDLQAALLEQTDHDMTALSRCVVATASHADVAGLCSEHPRLGTLLNRGAMVESAISREWIASMGRRDAYGRLAHLFCELFVRLDDVGLTTGAGYPMKLTQAELADTAGLSCVHVNRVLQQLRAERLITLSSGFLVILDWEGLMLAGEFDPAYLHVKKTVWLDGETAARRRTREDRPSRAAPACC